MNQTVLAISNWNVERVLPSQFRFDSLCTTIRSIESDIWIFTETHCDLRPQKHSYGVFSGTPERESKDGEAWCSIWSRWPITDLSEYVSDKSRCAAGIITESPFGRMLIYATVLPWSTDPRAHGKGSYETYKREIELQQKDWVMLRDRYLADVLIVAGDFNQSLAPRHYYGSSEKRKLLESVMSQSELEPITAMENDPVYRDSPPNACIDHIFVSRGDWKVASTSRWPNSISLKGADSDHYGIRVEISRVN